MNPYTERVKAFTDEQLDTLYQITQEFPNQVGQFDEAVITEWESRERSTKLTFYTPDVTKARHLLEDEQEEVTFAYSAAYSLQGKHLFNGWSPELEAAVVKLIIQLIEQL